MKKLFPIPLSAVVLIAACNNAVESTATGSSDSTAKSAVDLPYTASYSSNFTTDVSDADLKTILMTYKDWENGNVDGIANVLADTVTIDFTNGDHLKAAKADVAKIFGTFRDSLSSVKIDMQAWQKMYIPDKKEAYIVTWYDETDTYKSGKVDSASYHDINQVKDGKLISYAQYKRPKK